jgi:neutral ceramidase
MKMVKRLGWVLVIFFGIIIIFLAIVIKPVDRTNVMDTQLPNEMKLQFEKLSLDLEEDGPIAVGYAVENLTPPTPIPLAGYGNRKGKPYTSILDSIYIRTMVLQQGEKQVAIVSADMLIIPPTVVEVLKEALPLIGFSLANTYLGATHTHNSIGQWGEGATRFIYGKYDADVVDFIARKIITSIVHAKENLVQSTLHYIEMPMETVVRGRLENQLHVDSTFRAIEVKRADSTKLLLMTFSAHATCLYSKQNILSRDYPGPLVDQMESRAGYTFAMFMAGAVGSHTCSPPAFGETCNQWMADHMVDIYLERKSHHYEALHPSLGMMITSFPLSEAQVKLTKGLAVRSWFFKKAFGDYPVFISALQIGNVVMLGTPCDFSGELGLNVSAHASQRNLHAMITSFNGGYIGYVTPQRYFDVDHYETRLMNWYQQGTGEYMRLSLNTIIDVVSPYDTL